jgi:membrane protein required for colicin V production
VADAIGFLLIALVVMVAGQHRWIAFWRRPCTSWGLGCLDKLAGGAFGFCKGALLVTLCILVAVAFFPRAHWLAEGQAAQAVFRGLPSEHAHEPG